MIVSIIVGKKADGIFCIDTKLRKILSVDIKNENFLRMNFPKIINGYNYDELEDLMRFYTKEEMNLEEIVCDIRDNGFFYSIKPSLTISIEEVK